MNVEQTKGYDMTDRITEHENNSDDLLSKVVAAHGSGEERPQQRQMVKIVTDSIANRNHAVIQAGTGVGKSIGYLVPLIESRTRAVISTATKQLSEQLKEESPFLNKVLTDNGMEPVNIQTMKGRSNYICKRKVEELKDQNARDEAVGGEQQGFELDIKLDPESKVARAMKVSKEIQEVVAFVEDAPAKFDGDRTNCPSVSDEGWSKVSATSQECVGAKACPFGEVCFTELAKIRAAEADIVVTNHALVAQELSEKSSGMVIGDRQTVVFDEAHELDRYLSESWGVSFGSQTIKEIVKACKQAVPTHFVDARDAIEHLEYVAEDFEAFAEEVQESTLFDAVNPMPVPLQKVLQDVAIDAKRIMPTILPGAEEDMKKALACNLILKAVEDVAELITHTEGVVRWFEYADKGKSVLKTAPLRIGPTLVSQLKERDMNMIVTSATITVGGEFTIPARNLALDEDEAATLIDVGTPFDYKRQGILYVPAVDDMPAPVGRERQEHSDAVLEEIVDFVKAAGGRTLALSTTTSGARRMAEVLRANVDTKVLSHLDGSAGALSKEFLEDETSTLCATMGMWHGLNIPGKSLTCVYIDKIPFANSQDPLLKARMEDVNHRGGNGFMEVYAAQAANMLAQGVGRLIRNMTDRGVVVIADTRLRSKGYGRKLLKDLPDMWQTSDKETALSALKRLSS